jgi:hypothetical protein
VIDLKDGKVDYWWLTDDDGKDDYWAFIGGTVRVDGPLLHISSVETSEHYAETASVPVARIAAVSATERSCLIEVDGVDQPIAISAHDASATTRSIIHSEIAATIAQAMRGVGK